LDLEKHQRRDHIDSFKNLRRDNTQWRAAVPLYFARFVR
jgi:hypothetical protein